MNSIREFMRKCPYLNGDKRVHVDYLPNEVYQYSIESVPTQSLIKKYVDGGEVNQFVFTFASKEHYGADVITNLDNCGFYENVASWIKKSSDNNLLPELSGSKSSMYMEILDSGYLYQADETKARYQMQLRLVYYEK